jgi:hypothetical protein
MVDRVTFVAPETGPNAPAPEPDANRPEWLDPKFESPEKQAQAYKEAQAELTRAKQELAALKGTPPADPSAIAPEAPDENAEGDEKPEVKPEGDEKTTDEKQDDAAKAAAEAAGIDLNPYQEEFVSTGDVSEDGRKAITEALSKSPAFKDLDVAEMVNDYIEGKKAMVANDRAMFLKTAGGEDQYNAMVTWAANNFSEAEQAAYNKAVEGKDRAATMLAIEGLKSRYEAANGRDAPRLEGAQAAGGTTGYATNAEMMRDMKDPRYKTDAAFRALVTRRLAATN